MELELFGSGVVKFSDMDIMMLADNVLLNFLCLEVILPGHINTWIVLIIESYPNLLRCISCT